MNAKVIDALFSYEKEQEKRLENERVKSSKSLEKEKELSRKRVEKKKQEFEQELSTAITTAKNKAISDLNKLREEYKDKTSLIEKNSKKNFDKAAERILIEIVKNV